LVREGSQEVRGTYSRTRTRVGREAVGAYVGGCMVI
jgi:hypothetical protein